MTYTTDGKARPQMNELSTGRNLDPSRSNQNRRARFFDWAHYVLAGGIAGVAVGGVIAPLLGLDAKEAASLLWAFIGVIGLLNSCEVIDKNSVFALSI